MGELVSLRQAEPQGSHLCTVEFYRQPDGSIRSRLVYMDGPLIETTGEDTASCMQIIAGWMAEGAADMERQSTAFLHPAPEGISES
jgi:hypothetical protein